MASNLYILIATVVIAVTLGEDQQYAVRGRLICGSFNGTDIPYTDATVWLIDNDKVGE